jgi:hypothetical protein
MGVIPRTTQVEEEEAHLLALVVLVALEADDQAVEPRG